MSYLSISTPRFILASALDVVRFPFHVLLILNRNYSNFNIPSIGLHNFYGFALTENLFLCSISYLFSPTSRQRFQDICNLSRIRCYHKSVLFHLAFQRSLLCTVCKYTGKSFLYILEYFLYFSSDSK